MKTLKQDIKNLANQQPVLKNQRRTVHIVGDRTMNASQAFSTQIANRHQLRLLYAVQQLIFGKTLPEIEPRNKKGKAPLGYFKTQLDKLVLKYSEEPVIHHS